MSFGFAEDLTKIADTFYEDDVDPTSFTFKLLNVWRSDNTFRKTIVCENTTNSELNGRKHRNLTF
jgi:hypothetical protein